MMKSTYLKILLSVCGASLALSMLVNWVVDPMRYYHQPWFDIGYSENQRFQNPGLARTADYDIALIGTSHTELFTTAYMDQKLGGRSLNLSMSGSLIREQKLLLDLVLKTGKAKRVLWEINYPSFSVGDAISQPESFPSFMFQNGAETPFLYLLSWETLQESFMALSGMRVNGLDELHRWDLTAEFGEERVMKSWEYQKTRWNDKLRDVWRKYEASDKQLAELVRSEVMDTIRMHPHVQFDLLFLPTSMLEYVGDFQVSAARHSRRMNLRKEIARQVGTTENVRLWDFQRVDWMRRDLAHYKDDSHFDQQVAQAIVDSLASGKGQVSPGQLATGAEELAKDILIFARQFCGDDENHCPRIIRENLQVL